MTNSFAPSSSRVTIGNGPGLTRLYAVNNGSEFEFRTSGPADGDLEINADGEFEVIPGGTDRVGQAADQSLFIY